MSTAVGCTPFSPNSHASTIASCAQTALNEHLCRIAALARRRNLDVVNISDNELLVQFGSRSEPSLLLRDTDLTGVPEESLMAHRRSRREYTPAEVFNLVSFGPVAWPGRTVRLERDSLLDQCGRQTSAQVSMPSCTARTAS